MIDISTIGVEFQTDGLVKGTAALKNAELAANKTADAADEISRAAKTMDKSMGSAMTSIRNHLGTLAAGFSALQTASKLVNVQREFDVLNSSLITVTGSSAKAAQEFAWIKQFAATTPYQLNEVTGAFVKMKALGLDASQKALTSYGNTASAMGKGINQMIEAVADAATGEFERLKEFGIKAKQNGDQVSLTFQGVTKTIGNNATEITKYLTAIGEVEFSGAMAERAKTLDGALSNLADSWDELFRTVNQNATGTVIFDSVSLASKAVSDAITIIKSMNDVTADNAKQTGAMAVVQEALAVVFETVAVLGANVKYVLVGIGNEIGGLMAQIGQYAKSGGGAFMLYDVLTKGRSAELDAIKTIRAEMVSDAKAARAEIDATTERILGARKAAEDLAKWNTRNASANSDPRRVDLASAAPKATTATKKSLDEAAKALEFYNDLMDLASGYSKTYAEDQRKLALALKNGSINYDQYVAAVQKLMSLQPGVIAAIKAEEKATKDRVANTLRSINAELDAYYKERDAIDGVSKSLNDLARANAEQTDALAFESTLMGQSATDRAKAIEQHKLLARYKLEAAKITDIIADPAVRAAMLANLAVQQQQALNNAARAIDIAAWNSTFDRINESLVDALIAAGHDGGAALRSVVEQELITKPFKITLQGVLQPVTQSLTSAAVGGNALDMATGGMSSLLGSSSMGALDIAGFSVPQIGLALAAISLLSSIGGNFVSAADSGRARVDYSSAGLGGAAYNTTGDAAQIAAATANTNALAKTYFDTASALGVKAMQAAFEVGTNTGREGAAPQTVLGVNIGKVGYSSGEVASGDSAALSLAASRAVLTALQASEIPKYLSNVFSGITASTATQDQITAAIQYAGSLKTIREALLETREPLQIVKDNVAAAFASLGTSAETFKTDFVAAIDGGITGDALSSWQALGTGLDTLAADSKAAADSLAKTNRTWQDQLDILTGSETSRSLALRDANDETTKSLMRQVYAQQDLKDSTEAAIAAQKDRLSTNLDAATTGASNAFAALQRAVDAQRATDTAKYEADKAIATAAYTSQQTLMQASIDRTRASLDAVTASVGKLKSLSNSLKSTLDGMRIAGSDNAYRAAAQAQISAALATARSGGGLPLDGQLASALSTVSKPSEQLFATFEDYARDFYKTANDISALSGLTDAQLTADELTQKILQAQSETLTEQSKLLKDGFHDQVSVLDDILSNAQKQLDAANGLDVSVLSVAAALANFNASISALAAERTAQALPTSGASKAADYMTTNADVAGAYKDNTYGLGATDYANVHFGLYGKDEGRASPVADTKAKSYFELYPDVAAAFADMSAAEKAKYDIETQVKFSARHYANFGKDEKRIYPGFASGINYVPYDMTARIHEGEAVLPKVFNPYNPNASGNGDTAAALRALADRLDRIEANTRATAGHTAGTDRKLARVIPGNALITEVAV